MYTDETIIGVTENHYSDILCLQLDVEIQIFLKNDSIRFH